MFTSFTCQCVCVKHINVETWTKRNLIDNLSYLTLSILKDGFKLLTTHQKRNINNSDNFPFLIGNDLALLIAQEIPLVKEIWLCNNVISEI